MKALTIWQPWATLIIAGAKPYEFRGWRFPSSMIGQRIVIHAGSRPMRRAEVEDLQHRLFKQPELAWSTCLRPEIAEPILRRAWLQTTDRGRGGDFFDGAASPYEPLPLAAGIGSAVLGTPREGWSIAEEFGGAVNDSDRGEHSNWGWPLTDIEPFAEPVEAKGAQGFWPWFDAAEAAA